MEYLYIFNISQAAINCNIQYVYTDDSIGDVTYCPLTYCRHMLENGAENPKLQDVVTALYWYWNKADVYFEN